MSSIRVTVSFIMENWIWYRAPVSGRVFRPYLAPSRAATAFFTMAWQAGTEWRAEFRQCPFTGNWPPLGMNRSQGRARVPWNRASKSPAGKVPSTISTRSPVRRFRFSRGRSAQVPLHSTRPFSARTWGRFNRRISSAHRPSRPNRVGTAKVKFSIMIYLVLSCGQSRDMGG